MLIEKSAPETSCSSRLDGIAKPSWLNARFNLLRPCPCPEAIFSSQYKISTLFGVRDEVQLTKTADTRNLQSDRRGRNVQVQVRFAVGSYGLISRKSNVIKERQNTEAEDSVLAR